MSGRVVVNVKVILDKDRYDSCVEARLAVERAIGEFEVELGSAREYFEADEVTAFSVTYGRYDSDDAQEVRCGGTDEYGCRCKATVGHDGECWS